MVRQQTSTADMLDLAVEHIKGLQSELQVRVHGQLPADHNHKRPSSKYSHKRQPDILIREAY
jgi:hypothetical protein